MTETESKITVVDDIMGSGKTSYMIEYMNAYPEKSYIYCTPLLSEVERIRKCCPQLDFKEPIHENGGRKIDSFNNLLSGGKNIVLTHSTFANATPETVQYIRDSNYILILDEVIETLEDYNDIAEGKKLSEQDVECLLNEYVDVDENGVVSWKGERYGEGWAYFPIMQMADNKSLLLLNKTLFVWQFPNFIFELFEHTYVLTYLFNGSIMKHYLDYHEIKYGMMSMEGKEWYDEEGDRYTTYRLTEYRQDTEKQKQYREKVEIWDNPKANNFKAHSLSKTWCSRSANKPEMEQLKRNLANYFRNVVKAKAEQIMWTCRKSDKKLLQGAGYTVIRRLTQEERMNLSITEQEDLEKHLSCFVSSNAKATNDFRGRSVLAYCLNLYPQPHIMDYFQKRKIKFDKDLFALSIMLQWIWRSRIRDGEPIKIYIPSTRMRTLFEKWLAGEKYE